MIKEKGLSGRLTMCTTVLHGGVCRRTSTPHKSENKMKEKKKKKVVTITNRRSTAWAVSLMLLSHCGEYPCEYKRLIFAANSPEMIRLARRLTETSEALQMVTNACEFLRNTCEFRTKLTIT